MKMYGDSGGKTEALPLIPEGGDQTPEAWPFLRKLRREHKRRTSMGMITLDLVPFFTERMRASNYVINCVLCKEPHYGEQCPRSAIENTRMLDVVEFIELRSFEWEDEVVETMELIGGQA